MTVPRLPPVDCDHPITVADPSTDDPTPMPSTALSSAARNSTSSSTSAATTATTTTAESPDGVPPPKLPLTPPPPAHLRSPSQSSTQPVITTTGIPKQKHNLLNIPLELLRLIISHLDFPSIVRLRLTSHALRAAASPYQMRILHKPMGFQSLLHSQCQTCLSPSTTPSGILLPLPSDPGYPLACRCVRCAMIEGDTRLVPGKKVDLANMETVHVCRWCGWPIAERIAETGRQHFHRRCERGYHLKLFRYFVLGWVQFGLGVTGAAMAWRWFRGVEVVFAPTVTSFLLLWICMMALLFRGDRKRTYHITLMIELAILALWIPPVYYLAKQFALAKKGDEPIPKSSVAALAIFALNMLWRLLNVLGNILLLCNYDMTRRHRPNPSIWRKMVHPFASRLVYWTYPQSLERKYPP